MRLRLPFGSSFCERCYLANAQLKTTHPSGRRRGAPALSRQGSAGGFRATLCLMFKLEKAMLR
jgi:hypothetical protein